MGVVVKTAVELKIPAGQSKNDDDTTRYVLWMDGDDHGRDISHYFIEFRTQYDQHWRVHPDGDSKKTFVHEILIFLMRKIVRF